MSLTSSILACLSASAVLITDASVASVISAIYGSISDGPDDGSYKTHCICSLFGKFRELFLFDIPMIFISRALWVPTLAHHAPSAWRHRLWRSRFARCRGHVRDDSRDICYRLGRPGSRLRFDAGGGRDTPTVPKYVAVAVLALDPPGGGSCSNQEPEDTAGASVPSAHLVEVIWMHLWGYSC